MTLNIRWSLEKVIISCKCRIREFLCCQPVNKENSGIDSRFLSNLKVTNCWNIWTEIDLFMSTLRGCQSQGNVIMDTDLFWRNYCTRVSQYILKLFKYSSSLNLPRVWICQSYISHPFFNVQTKQRFHTFDVQTSWNETNPKSKKASPKQFRAKSIVSFLVNNS